MSIWPTTLKRSLGAMLPSLVRRERERRYFLRTGEIELHLVPILCDPARDAIDVGANEGAYLHAMIGHARRVLAFEPIPSLADALEHKFGRRVIVSRLALSCEAGDAVLHIPLVDDAPVTGLASLTSAPATVHREVRVTTARLDEVYDGDVRFIKIDVEGHEAAMLEGAENTIGRCRPRIVVELEERFSAGTVARGRAWFARAGYRGFYVHRRILWPIEDFRPEILQRPEVIGDFAFSGPRAAFADYVNNFVFLPEEDCAALLLRIADTLARAD